MKVKQILAGLLCASMIISLTACGKTSAPAVTAEEVPGETEEINLSSTSGIYAGTAGSANDYFIPYAESIESFETVTVPCYLDDVSEKREITIGVLNGMSDIPYLSLDTVARLLDDTFLIYGYDETYSIDVGPADDNNTIFVMVRENDAAMTVDFNSGLITFTDIDLFTADPDAANAMDIISTTENNDCISIMHNSLFYRAGDTIMVDLMHYGILPVLHDGEGYLPLQTIADLLYDRIGLLLLYDGVEVMVASGIEYPYPEDDIDFDDLFTDLDLEDEELEESDMMLADTEEVEESEQSDGALEETQTLSDLYYAAPKSEKSEALSTFTYNELCLALDYNYGLQSEHGIDSFNELFLQSGLSEQLHSSDAGDVYLALTLLCSRYFADLHSAANAPSYMTELDPNSSEIEAAQFYTDVSVYSDSIYYSFARDAYYPEGPVGYEEVGDTAYITFDMFVFDAGRDYYNTEITNNPDDTVELLIYADQQIKRENSPVKNVVVDLTNNGGGMADAAACVLSWMLNSATINLVDPISGAQSTTSYTFDANIDGTCDNMGTDALPLSGINIYCMISPNSFSCGNLVPNMLADSGRVTLIGRASGGGACVVENLSTADGNIFQISGPMRISSVYNGSYYSVDEGVEPDIYIADYNHLYDRAYMTELIDNLP